MEFKKGQRVEWSEAGIAAVSPTRPGNKGTVVGFSINRMFTRIHWDGYSDKTSETLHPCFVEGNDGV